MEDVQHKWTERVSVEKAEVFLVLHETKYLNICQGGEKLKQRDRLFCLMLYCYGNDFGLSQGDHNREVAVLPCVCECNIYVSVRISGNTNIAAYYQV